MMNYFFKRICCILLFAIFIVFAAFSQNLNSPKDIPGLQYWLRADSGVVLNSATVSQWSDVSGNTRNAIQPTTAAQPLYVTSVSELNNKPVVRFDGLDDHLLINSGDTVGSVFVVSKWMGSLPDFSGYNSILTQQAYSSGTGLFIGQQGTSGFYAGNSDVLFGATDLYVNGQQTISLAPLDKYKILGGVNSASPKVFNDYVIGRFFEYTGFWNGDIAEVIVYKTKLTVPQRKQVEQYLSNKYAPPVNLGPDQTVSYGFCPARLNAHKDWFASYLWNTGATTDSIAAPNSGIYSVTVTNTFGYVSSDTINVTFPGNLSPFASNKTLCYGDTLVWNTGLDKTGYTFLWQDNSTDSLYKITQAGPYYVTVTDTIGVSGCSVNSYTLTVTVDNFSQTGVVSLGADQTLCSGESIALTSGAGQTTSYTWSTGASTSSIVITAPSTNTYSVVVHNANGCTAMDTINITVKGTAPLAGFTAPATCFGSPFVFTDTTVAFPPDNIATWSWNFGDGNISAAQNPVHSYNIAGNYIVTLAVVSDSGCPASVQHQVVVYAKPNSNFTHSLACSGTQTFFSDLSSVSSGSITNWHWDFGVAALSNDTSNSKNTSYTYSAVGTYTVSLIVTTAKGCKDTAVSVITVNQTPTAGFTATNVCLGSVTSFTDISAGSIFNWQWDFGDNTSHPTIQNPTHVYSIAGTFTVTLTVTSSNGCDNTIKDTIHVHYLPVPQFTGDSACVKDPLQFTDISTISGSTINTWNWNFGAYGTSALQNPITTYTASGNYTVALTVTSAQTCSASVTQSVFVQPLPHATFSFLPHYGAPPLTVGFNNSLTTGATGYQWIFGDGGISNQQNPSYTYADTGLYPIKLIVQSAFGCIDSMLDTIFVAYPDLDITVKAVTTNLSGNTIQVTAWLYNAGTLDVSNMELSAHLDNGPPIHEMWNGFLAPHAILGYTFNSSFENVNNRYSVVCADVLSVNAKDDDDLSNNHSCAPVTGEFTVLDPFPNPTDDEIFFMFILPSSGKVNAQIYDVRGREVEIVSDKEMQKGLNTFDYPTLKLEQGMYLMRLTFGDKTAVKVFMKK